jgi:hypothetical protein
LISHSPCMLNSQALRWCNIFLASNFELVWSGSFNLTLERLYSERLIPFILLKLKLARFLWLLLFFLFSSFQRFKFIILFIVFNILILLIFFSLSFIVIIFNIFLDCICPLDDTFLKSTCWNKIFVVVGPFHACDVRTVTFILVTYLFLLASWVIKYFY